MILTSEISLNTSLSQANNSIENFEDYVYDINQIIDLSKIKYETYVITERFGCVHLGIYCNKNFINDTGKGTIDLCIIDDRESIDENEWYNYITNDGLLMHVINKLIKACVESINDIISSIKHPVDENLVYYNNRIYMEINEYSRVCVKKI